MKSLTIRRCISPFFVFLLIAFILTSCQLMYMPTINQAPMLSQKGELKASATMGSYLNFEIHSAYAITDHIGIMANGNYYSNRVLNQNKNYTIEQSNYGSDIGLGYFTRFNTSGKFEIYGGAGMGRINGQATNQTTNEHESVSGNMNRFFLQPALGGVFNSLFLKDMQNEYIVALRFSGVNMFDETKYFADPCLITKTGNKKIRLVTSIGYSLQISQSKTNYWNHYPMILGFGLEFIFGIKPAAVFEEKI